MASDEALRHAAASMSTSAESMRQTAGYLDESLTRFLARFDELVTRLERVSEKQQVAAPFGSKPADWRE